MTSQRTDTPLDARSIATLLRLLASKLDPTPKTSSDDPAASAVATVRAFLDAYASGDIRTATERVAPDLVYRVPGQSTISGTFEGVQGLNALAAIAPRQGAADLATSTEQLIPSDDGSTVASYHTLTGTLDNQRIAIELTLRFDLRNGQIATITEYTHHQKATDNLFAGATNSRLNTGR